MLGIQGPELVLLLVVGLVVLGPERLPTAVARAARAAGELRRVLQEGRAVVEQHLDLGGDMVPDAAPDPAPSRAAAGREEAAVPVAPRVPDAHADR